MIWDQLTSEELASCDRHTPVLLLTAATEQHGSHLPLATDRLIGEHFLNVLEQRISQDVLILPSVAVGCSDHHLSFPGSLSLSHRAFMNQVCDIIKQVFHHGFHKVVIFNSHGGNQAANQVIVEDVGYNYPDKQIVTTSWWRIAGDSLKNITTTGPGGVGHAGEFETSVMMYIDPDLVRGDKVVPGSNQSTFSWAEADLLRSSGASYYRTMREMTPNGVYGDPTQATVNKGEQITEAVVHALTKLIQELKTDQ
ncbi:MAG: creatininase family protein [Cyclobacteriaceae bacterium]|nr:creatininase family protein [Cyclobacteriaceae bacterium]